MIRSYYTKAGLMLLGFFLFIQSGLSQSSAEKKLIIHCDDLGVAHSVNQAGIEFFEKGFITSASIMVPTPWFSEIANYGAEHPDLDIGLHLTLTSEWDNYKWGPVSGRDKVPSLVDKSGFMYSTSEEAIANIKPEEAEIELRAQIDLALANGLKPSHLDSHMGVLFYSPALFQVYLKVGEDYGIPVFVPKVQLMQGYADMAKGLEFDKFKIDTYWSIEPSVQPENWTGRYVDFINELPDGVTLIIVHLGVDTYELEHIMGKETDYGSEWRQRDMEAMKDSEFTHAIKTNNIHLTTYRELYKQVGEN